MGSHALVIVVLLAMASMLAFAYDPSPLQDFCVALNDTKDGVFVNGKFCKDPKLATADDFFFTGLAIPGNTNNTFGTALTLANVNQIPGLNTLGISLVRIDYAPFGLNPPHTHPRGTEIFIVLEGTIFAGFITSDPDNRFFAKLLKKGDVFVFPIGLIHFNVNVGDTDALALAGFNSQNPGLINIADATFGSNPPINDEILAKAFQVDKKVIDRIQSKFSKDNICY